MKINIVYDDVLIDPLVTSVNWSGDIQTCARKLDVALVNTEDGRTRRFDFLEGKEVRFLKEAEELFRGVLIRSNINARGQQTLTAYDENFYLTKSQDDRIFRGVPADVVFSSLCSDFGLSVGTVTPTGYVIPKLILRDKTLWDMMTIALTLTQKATGRRFFITSRQGKIHLLERKTQASRWVLENGVNILDASYSRTIENMSSQVKVKGGDETSPLIAVVKNDVLIAKYGIMQHLESADSDMNQGQIEELGRQLLKDLGTIEDDASIDAIGISDVIAGSAVYVQEKMTGIVGGYYVSTDSHTFGGGSHKMSITLSATDDLPTMEYDEPKEAK